MTMTCPECGRETDYYDIFDEYFCYTCDTFHKKPSNNHKNWDEK